MAVKGVFASDSGGINDRVGDFTHAICRTYPTGDAPLFALGSGMRRVRAMDTTINWDEMTYFSDRVKVMQDLEGDCCTITLEDTSTVISGSIYEVECTGEVIHVLGVMGNEVTVRRGVGQTGRFQIPAGSYIQKIGTAFAEGSEAPKGYVQVAYPRFNYTQIFKNGFGVTRTAQAIRRHSTNNLYARNKGEAMQQHSADIERAMIWGVRSYGMDSEGRKLLTMDGINRQIQTNRWTMPSTGVSLEILNLIVKIVFSKNIKGKPNERLVFCGNDVVAVVQDIVRHHTNYDVSHMTTTFGMDISKWKTPFGMLTFVTHPLMNMGGPKSAEMYIYHPGAITQHWLRDTRPEENNKNGTRNGIDADQGHLVSELSTSYACEITGALVYNFCKPDLRKMDYGYKTPPCCSDAPDCGCGSAGPTDAELKMAGG